MKQIVLKIKRPYTCKVVFVINTLLISMLLSGCQLLFKNEEISISKIENYDQLINATCGVYGQFSQKINSLNFYILNTNADDIFINNASSTLYNYYSGTGSSTCIKGTEHVEFDKEFIYKSFYSVIASINNVLSQYDLSVGQDNKTLNVLGELLYLRAYCYYRLTRTYGQVPLVSDTDVDYYLPKPSYNEIYEFIETDLLNAANYLPSFDECRIPNETPHSGTAKALLAEVYLSWAGYPANENSKYLLAKETASEVIENAANYNFGLSDDFNDLWNTSGRYNQENIFSVYSNTANLESLGYYYLVNGFSITKNENVPSLPFGVVTNRGLDHYNTILTTEVNFFNEFPEGYRKDITFFNNIYLPPGENNNIDTGFIHIEDVEPCSRIYYRKLYGDTLRITQQKFMQFDSSYVIHTYYTNPRICLYRYAHTLLTYAEAAARSGEADQKAYNCLNMIRRRANKSDINTPSKYDIQAGLSAEAFADSVAKERGWEFAGEPEGRWFDLLRLGRCINVINTRGSKEDNFIFRNEINSSFLLPIPESDKILNPNFKE